MPNGARCRKCQNRKHKRRASDYDEDDNAEVCKEHGVIHGVHPSCNGPNARHFQSKSLPSTVRFRRSRTGRYGLRTQSTVNIRRRPSPFQATVVAVARLTVVTLRMIGTMSAPRIVASPKTVADQRYPGSRLRQSSQVVNRHGGDAANRDCADRCCRSKLVSRFHRKISIFAGPHLR